MKTCSKCQTEKSLTEFGMTTSHGKPWRRAICKACQSLSQQTYRKQTGYRPDQLQRNRELKQRNRKWIEQQKSRPCFDCNIQYPSYVMDFDHVKGIKAFGIARATQSTASLKTLEAEISKCQVVCVRIVIESELITGLRAVREREEQVCG